MAMPTPRTARGRPSRSPPETDLYVIRLTRESIGADTRLRPRMPSLPSSGSVIAGSGTIACGLAVCAATRGLQRDAVWPAPPTRRHAPRRASRFCARRPRTRTRAGRVTVSEDPSDIPAVPMAVEAVVESEPVKRELLRRARPAPAGGCADRHHDLVAQHLAARGVQRPAGAVLRPARLQPRRPHAAGGALLSRPGTVTTPGGGPCAFCARDRQDRGRGAGRARLRRQPAALPLPVRRGSAAGAHRAWRRRRSTPA